MSIHDCEPPVDPIDGPPTWTCSACGRIWERREENEPEFYDVWYQPREGSLGEHACGNCERCTWNPGADCGKPDHPHCQRCGHCNGRHAGPAKVSPPE